MIVRYVIEVLTCSETNAKQAWGGGGGTGVKIGKTFWLLRALGDKI